MLPRVTQPSDQTPAPARSAAVQQRAIAVLALLAVAVVLLLVFRTSVPARQPVVIGALRLTEVDAVTFDGFKAGLRELGYVEGEHVLYRDPGAAGSVEALKPLAARLLAASPDLVFVSSTPATLALQRATRGNPVPLVFAPVNDPIAAGIVTSLRAPGGNLTGVRLPQVDGLRLRWLLRVAPGIKRVLVPYSPADQSALASLEQARKTAALLGVTLLAQPVSDPEAIAAEAGDWARRADALFLPRDSLIESQVAHFVAAANAARVPLCAPSLTQVEAGALLSYGFVHREIGRQAARLADQVLHGVPPADLPIETADRYLALNLQTAAAIGIAPSHEVLRQARVLIR